MNILHLLSSYLSVRKALVQLETTRRENDDRIVLIFHEMVCTSYILLLC